MQPIPLLINITLALVAAFIGGLAARRVGFPTIVGYLLAGILIGPFTPGFVGDVETIRQLADLGVIFLMFGVGLKFSFDDLWRVRDIAVPGAIGQTSLATLLGIGLSRLWGWPLTAGIVLGLSISVASTVVLLRGLMDHNLLNTSHGQAAIGWLVMEDILSVLILVVMPSFAASATGFDLQNLALTLVKAGAFGAIMIFAGGKLIPLLLTRIAGYSSKELFILAVLAITLGTSLAAAELFGVSLALGAFMAGAVVSQSRLSHQVGAEVVPFREAFSSLFFVAVGMLVNPPFLWEHIGEVLSLTLLIILGKAIITLGLGMFFPWPARTILVIAVGLSQVGEFSFILGQEGVSLGLMTADQYSLILAGALISITLNPFYFRLLPWLEHTLKRMPRFWKRLELHIDLPEPDEEKLEGHVVVVGFGRVGAHLVDVLDTLSIPLLVIETDVERIQLLSKRGIPTLYGDASNSEVLAHASLPRSVLLVSTIPEEDTTLLVVSTARNIHPELAVIARVASEECSQALERYGNLQLVNPELEGGLEIVHHALLQLGFPLRQVHEYSEAVRHDHYETTISSAEEHRTLHALLNASESIDISWVSLEDGSPLIGQTLLSANIRSRSGASVVAILREGRLIANPKSFTVFERGDQVGLIGDEEQIQAARELILELEGGRTSPPGAQAV